MSEPATLEWAPLPPEWREHYAELAAQWVRQKGTLPPSIEALAAWAMAPVEPVSAEDELAFLEGRGPDPSSPSR